MGHIDVIWNILKDLFIWSTVTWVYDAPCVFRSRQKQEEGLGHLELDLQVVICELPGGCWDPNLHVDEAEHIRWENANQIILH